MDYNEQNDDGNDCIKQQWFVESYIMTILDVVFVFKQELFYQSIQGRFVKTYLGKEKKLIMVIPTNFVTYYRCTGDAIAAVRTSKQPVGPDSSGLKKLKKKVLH